LLDPEYLTVWAHEVHPEAIAGVRFQHTLRLPDGTPAYNSVRSDAFHLPRPLTEHAEGLSLDWLLSSTQHLVCLYASESLALEFDSPNAYPFAVKVCIGGIDCLAGGQDEGPLSRTPQNYIPLPCQDWLDAWQNHEGETMQFLPPPVGPPDDEGIPPPREDEMDRISVTFVPMKASAFERHANNLDLNAGRPVYGTEDFPLRFQESKMFDGRMKYELEKGAEWDAGMVYPDPFEPDDWEIDQAQAVSVTMVRPAAWTKITKEPPPGPHFERQIYEDAGVPWFENYADKN